MKGGTRGVGLYWWLSTIFTFIWEFIDLTVHVVSIYCFSKIFGAQSAHQYFMPAGQSSIVTGLTAEEFVASFGSYHAWLRRYKSVKLDAFKKVWLGGPAYNASVITKDGKYCKLLDFQKEGRPLVLNFGSCT